MPYAAVLNLSTLIQEDERKEEESPTKKEGNLLKNEL